MAGEEKFRYVCLCGGGGLSSCVFGAKNWLLMALVLSVKLKPSAASVMNPVRGLPSARHQRSPSDYIDSNT